MHAVLLDEANRAIEKYSPHGVTTIAPAIIWRRRRDG